MAVAATESELLEQAQALSGLRIGDLCGQLDEALPARPGRAKGFVGELIEKALHATAGSRPVPDFEHLGVELKTLPVDSNGRPRESTYVCSVPLIDNVGMSWENSPVRRKLRRVLWVPYHANREHGLAERVIGNPLLWSPDPAQENILRRDFDELMDKVCLGELAGLSAAHGIYLQIRPKGANARHLAPGIDAEGRRAPTLPRGFYLRAKFTAEILAQNFLASPL
jgi:DNA mismatch repair protein MutH